MASGYTFHNSYYEATKALSPEDRLAIFDAMNLYAFEGIDTDFEDSNLAMAWNLIRPNVDSSLKRSKTNAENARKTTAKTVAKTTAKTNEKTVDSPDSLGMERNGTDKERNGVEIDTPSFPLLCLKVFNDVFSTNYGSLPSNAARTLERFDEKYTVEEVQAMLTHMRDQWTGTKFQSGLTPKKLFGSDDFEAFMHQSKQSGKEASRDNYDIGECIEI